MKREAHQPSLTFIVDIVDGEVESAAEPVSIDDPDAAWSLGDENFSGGRERDAPRNLEVRCYRLSPRRRLTGRDRSCHDKQQPQGERYAHGDPPRFRNLERQTDAWVFSH
jgi:hypothetical protein